MKKLRTWVPFGVVLVVAAWSIWPVLTRPATAWAWGGDDGIITWEMNQTMQKIPGGLNHLFEGNIFYPYKKTAAFHMLLVPSAILGYLPVKLSGNPVAAYNTAIIVAQFLTVTVLYLWWKELTGNKWAAAVGTIAFAMCQIRFFFDVHIHMWIMQWFLISAWMLWRYSQNRKVWQLYVAGLGFGVQCWESIYQAYWIGLVALFFLLPHVRDLIKQKKHVLLILSGVTVFISPVVYAYGLVYRQFGYGGSIREAAHFAMSLNDLWGKFMSPGLYALLVVAICRIFNFQFLNTSPCPSPNTSQRLALRVGEGTEGRGITADVKWLFFLLVAGLVMALGPVLKWNEATVKIFGKLFIPLPYGVVYYLIPGISVLRSVHRCIWLSALAASGMIAVGISRFNVRGGNGGDIKGKIGILCVLLVAIVGGGKLTPRGDFPKPADYPAVYSWLKSQPGQVILEYPVYTWADGEKYGREMYRMVYSLKHGKSLINGASGFVPPQRAELFGEIIKDYPNEELDNKLVSLGVNYIIVHKDEIDEEKLRKFKTDKNLVKTWEDKTAVVYEL
jgi:hypothetical protein